MFIEWPLLAILPGVVFLGVYRAKAGIPAGFYAIGTSIPEDKPLD